MADIRRRTSSAVQRFKSVYVHERRVLSRYRDGAGNPYEPSPKLDGVSRYDSPEEPACRNEWEVAYAKLKKMSPDIDPCRYVRILFWILRGTSLSIPTVQQLATPNAVDMVSKTVENATDEIRLQFLAASQRAKSAIVINQRGSGYPLSLAVYYAIVDSRLELPPLYKYCTAITTSGMIRSRNRQDPHCEKLDRLAKQYEFLASMDYTLFPEAYDAVWGDVIPGEFRAAAASRLEAALSR